MIELHDELGVTGRSPTAWKGFGAAVPATEEPIDAGRARQAPRLGMVARPTQPLESGRGVSPGCVRSSPLSRGKRCRAAGILCLLILLVAPGASGLTVLYTSSLNGNLDGCDCPGHPRAGLAARAAWLRALPGRDTALLVDAGNVLAGTGDRELSKKILETYAGLGYDALAVGGREIADGVDALTDYRDRFGLICQNLAICTSSHCLFVTPEPLMLEKAGVKVGLFALLDPKALAAYPKEATGDAKLVPPELLAASLVGQLVGAGAQWVVLLYHGPLKDAEALARKVRGIHVIIAGSEEKLLRPRKVGDALLVSPGEEGNRVGILELDRDGRGRVRYSHRFQLLEYKTAPGAR